MDIDPSATKYLIQARISADGIVEKPDVVGAIFGQTEGLLGDELDLRDLQKTGRIGRIEVEIGSSRGKSDGRVFIPSSLDQVETAILAAALETIDRVGPCKARINVERVEDVRVAKRTKIVERAKGILNEILAASKSGGLDIADSVRQSVQVEEIVHYGKDKCPAGPNIENSDAIIIVEGRSDVLNLLKYGIKNVIAVEGTNVPPTIAELSKERVATAFVDGDRGGELILRELLQVADVDFVARAPQGQEVEELTQKQIMKSLRNKIPAEQFREEYGLEPLPAEARNAGKREERRERAEREAPHERGPAPPPVPAKALTPEQERYRELLVELSGSSKARFLSGEGAVLRELSVRDLATALREAPKEMSTIVFDGIITQRLLDMAAELGVTTVVGTKLGTITKQPTAVGVWTKEDLT